MPAVDDRSPTAKAMSKVSEILALCLLMIIPALVGIWIDRQFSTVMLFTLLGLVFGMTGAIVQLVKLVSPKSKTGAEEIVAAGRTKASSSSEQEK